MKVKTYLSVNYSDKEYCSDVCKDRQNFGCNASLFYI